MQRALLLGHLLCGALGWTPIQPPAAARPQLLMPPSAAHAGLARAPTPHMPIGVPKVAYRVPGANRADWVDIYNRLYRERIMFLGQEIDDEVINQIIAVMLFSDSEDSQKPQYLYINSPGGSVIAGLALYDTMQHISSPIITCNIGMAASMASFILGAGERGKRIALPHSRVMVHQPMGGSEGQAEDIRVEAEQILKIKNTLVTQYAHMTGQTRERIFKDLDRDNYMGAEAALEYGLIDKIVTSVDGISDELL
jgi:ATP-dependent Clp endopeptidase proteolytic subunit ClpP